jgi:hypothetical protein
VRWFTQASDATPRLGPPCTADATAGPLYRRTGVRLGRTPRPMLRPMTGGRTYEFGIADRLRRARELAGFDQRAFEDASGISRATISNYEQGKYGKNGPGRVYVSAWATATGFDLDWLLTGKTEESNG